MLDSQKDWYGPDPWYPCCGCAHAKYIVQFVRILLKFIIWCTHYIIFINLQYNWNISSFNYNYMKYNSKSGIESRMKNGFSAMNVILRRAKYKFMTSSDTSEFAKTESYYYILTDRNENGFNHTSAYISLTLSRRLDIIVPSILLKDCF